MLNVVTSKMTRPFDLEMDIHNRIDNGQLTTNEKTGIGGYSISRG